ncbi:MAG: RNA 2',3'-cyclic phosphodiesterase [Thiohalophilus sp.]
MPTEDSRQRLFFALWPPLELGRQMRRVAVKAFSDSNVRHLQADQIHLTLIYLGPSDPAQRECAEMAAEQVSAAPFDLALSVLGYWARPRVGWIGPVKTPTALDSLVQQLQQRLPECGYNLDTRPWQAHITLVRKLRRDPLHRELATPLHWPVGDFALVESQTLPTGAQYRILHRWPLQSIAE